MRDQRIDEFGLVPPVGFLFDTTLAFARMIFSGFIDRYPNLKLIATHGGATLPYIAGRLDRCHEMIPACAESSRTSTHLRRIYYDAVVYDPRALDLCISIAGSPDQVLYGSTIRTISATWRDAWPGSAGCRPIRRERSAPPTPSGYFVYDRF